MKLLFNFCVLVLACSCHKRPAGCDNIIIHETLGEDKVFQKDAGEVRLSGNAMHDTTAIDLYLAVNDYDSGKPIQDVLINIINHRQARTDSAGYAGFYAFYNDGGKFNVSIQRAGYSCMMIKGLNFYSGQIIQLQIRLRKKP
jgi:hypothetical protein